MSYTVGKIFLIPFQRYITCSQILKISAPRPKKQICSRLMTAYQGGKKTGPTIKPNDMRCWKWASDPTPISTTHWAHEPHSLMVLRLQSSHYDGMSYTVGNIFSISFQRYI